MVCASHVEVNFQRIVRPRCECDGMGPESTHPIKVLIRVTSKSVWTDFPKLTQTFTDSQGNLNFYSISSASSPV
ncbi:hypothetical protein scyTo_0011092 [Scyliorhinus torazame]|uniref:Uncharacterized protein n=1 Tax=Scyliorhinus torazame TaxID=75743 RepID=A0A401NH70_SCYTO|nr:hypothetical protein [Scyliorhinus torazame]